MDGKRKSLQSHLATRRDQQLLHARAPAARGSQQQQLSTLRSQSQHRRQQLRREHGSDRAQPSPPLAAVSEQHYSERGQPLAVTMRSPAMEIPIRHVHSFVTSRENLLPSRMGGLKPLLQLPCTPVVSMSLPCILK